MRNIRLFFLTSALTPLMCAAQTSPAPLPTPACTEPQFHQFDFWIGSWKVTDLKGNQIGTSEITRVSAGCAILEHWIAPGGPDGRSLNYYDKSDGQWHQDWVGGGGGILHLQGHFTDGAMVLFSGGKAGNGAMNRITWTQVPGGKVRQEWDISTDEGKTWKVSFVGIYEKRS